MTRFSRFTSAICTLTLFLVLGACSSSPTTTYDESLDFTAPKNYAWIDDNPLKIGDTAEQVNPFLQGSIIKAMTAAMSAKGYNLVDDASSADFVVSFTFGSRDKIRQDSYPAGYGMGMGMGVGVGVGVGVGAPMMAGTTTTTYNEGQLAVDMFGADSKQPAWHGTYSHSISESDQKKLDESVAKAVNHIMDDFPPGQD